MQVMQAVILLPALLAFSIAFKHLDQEWETWKSKYGRKYLNADMEKVRRNAWEATWQKVRDHNLLADRGNKSYRLEMNHFADLTAHERESRGCLIAPRSAEKPMEVKKYRTNVNLPKEVDWRKENCVTEPKNQGSFCGSCWAFATVGALESRYCIKHKQLLDFSEQQLVDCDSRNRACCGGLPRLAFEYVSEHGIMKKEDYKYVEHAEMCAYQEKDAIKMNISKFYVLPEESNIAAAVAFEGPVTVAFAVSLDFMLHSGEGIFDGVCAEEVNHAIIIVGYGTEDGEDFWIIKNSWGTEWAENGYAKVKRNSNLCKIAQEAATADITGPREEE
ncbi:cathepsin S-like [Lissotriton helveticus]